MNRPILNYFHDLSLSMELCGKGKIDRLGNTTTTVIRVENYATLKVLYAALI